MTGPEKVIIIKNAAAALDAQRFGMITQEQLGFSRDMIILERIHYEGMNHMLEAMGGEWKLREDGTHWIYMFGVSGTAKAAYANDDNDELEGQACQEKDAISK